MATRLRRSIAHRAASPALRRLSTIDPAPAASTDRANTSALYDELMNLEQQEGVIRNTDFVCCEICDIFIDEYGAIGIRNCLHNVCISCVRDCIKKSRHVEVKCPVAECVYNLQDREVRSLLTQVEFANHINKAFEPSDGQLYEELKHMEGQLTILQSTENFECEICATDVEAADGMMLHECLHQFCIDCVRNTIKHTDDIQILCPNNDCNAVVSDREIRSLLTQSEFDKYMEKTLRVAETTIPNSYHCKKPNCNGWCIVEDVINFFQCPSCGSVNCLPCQAIHPGQNCKQYQKELKQFTGLGTEERSQAILDEFVAKGKAMRCTKCKIVIMKRDGCDYLLCPMCKTGLCWATRGPRWGPGGPGDTSGGCKCTVLKRCHPQCKNCH